MQKGCTNSQNPIKPAVLEGSDTPPHKIFDMLRKRREFFAMMSFKNSFLEAAEII
jgi:hypothetical protein